MANYWSSDRITQTNLLFQQYVDPVIANLAFRKDPIMKYLYEKGKKKFPIAEQRRRDVRFAANSAGAYTPMASKAARTESSLNTIAAKFDPKFYRTPLLLDEVQMKNAERGGKSVIVNYWKEQLENGMKDLENAIVLDCYTGDGASDSTSAKMASIIDLIDDVATVGGINPVSTTTYELFKSVVEREWISVTAQTLTNTDGSPNVTISGAHTLAVGDTIKFSGETATYVIKTVTDSTHVVVNKNISGAHTTSNWSKYVKGAYTEAELMAKVGSSETLFLEKLFRNMFLQSKEQTGLIIAGETAYGLIYDAARAAQTHQNQDANLAQFGIKTIEFMKQPVAYSPKIDTYTAVGINTDDLWLETWSEDDFRRSDFRPSHEYERAIEADVLWTGMLTIKERNSHFKITGLGNG